jgi:hypothetical protein
MASLTRKEVTEMLGELDDVAVADIIAMGATAHELEEAHAWLTNDEAPMNVGKQLPGGRVGQLIEIIAAKDEEEQDPT